MWIVVFMSGRSAGRWVAFAILTHRDTRAPKRYKARAGPTEVRLSVPPLTRLLVRCTGQWYRRRFAAAVTRELWARCALRSWVRWDSSSKVTIFVDEASGPGD